MALTEIIIKNAKPKEKPYSLSDGRGLILDIRPNGSKYWIARLWIDGKEKRKSLGSYPNVSLKAARDKNYEIRKEDKRGPSGEYSFKELASEWFNSVILPDKSKNYIRTVELRLNKYLIPEFGNRKLNEITPNMILLFCRQIEKEGLIDTSHRLRQFMKQIFDYAITTDRTLVNPASAISKALQPHRQEHYATVVDNEDIGALMRSVYAYPQRLVRYLMIMSALTFVRPGEIRQAEWKEFDLNKKEWRIPAEKMKEKSEHVVPLSTEAIRALKELLAISGNKTWLFPSPREGGRHLSDGAVRMALRSMGYEKEDMTAHGFRSMASTSLNEYEWAADVIEHQLSHVDRNTIRRTYNRAQYMSQRIAMMEWWGDFLIAVRDKKDVPIKPNINI